MAGHVFVSYSRADSKYVEKLVQSLTSRGLRVWMDTEINLGDRWISEITRQIRECAAFVPVMSPSAEASQWVQREVQYAEGLAKPFVPVLLEGQPFLQLINLQYETIVGGRLPGEKFFATLSQLCGPAEAEPVVRTAPARSVATKPTDPPNPAASVKPVTAAEPAALPKPVTAAKPAAPPKPAVATTSTTASRKGLSLRSKVWIVVALAAVAAVIGAMVATSDAARPGVAIGCAEIILALGALVIRLLNPRRRRHTEPLMEAVLAIIVALVAAIFVGAGLYGVARDLLPQTSANAIGSVTTGTTFVLCVLWMWLF
jgi:hypothetical protein